MNKLPYQKFYWGDYLRDTRHLSTEEHGAYLLLIAAYWEAGRAPPDDDQQLARLAGLSLKKWKMVRPKISRFFEISEGHFYHFRIEKDLAASAKALEVATEKGKKGGRPRKPAALAQDNLQQTRRVTPDKALSTLITQSSTYPNGQVEQRNSSTFRGNAAQPQTRSRSEFPEIPDDHHSAPPTAPAEPANRRSDENCVGTPLVEIDRVGPPDCQNAVEQRPRPIPGRLPGIPEQPAAENRQAIAACLAAAGPGLADPAKTPSLHLTAARIGAAIAAGCDLESDIIPVIQARTANRRASPITTWSYFETAWIDQRDRRLAGLPEPDPIRFSKEIAHASPAHNVSRRSPREQREIRHRAAIDLLRELGELDGPGEFAIAL